MLHKYYNWNNKIVYLYDLNLGADGFQFVVYDCIDNSKNFREGLRWYPYLIVGMPYLVDADAFIDYSVLPNPCEGCVYLEKLRIHRTGVSMLTEEDEGEQVFVSACGLRKECFDGDADLFGLHPKCSYKQTEKLPSPRMGDDGENETHHLHCLQLLKDSKFVFVQTMTYYPDEQDIERIFWSKGEEGSVLYSFALSKTFEQPSDLLHNEWSIKRSTSYCKQTFSKDRYYSDIIFYDLGELLISFDAQKTVYCPAGVPGYFLSGENADEFAVDHLLMKKEQGREVYLPLPTGGSMRLKL